MEYYNRKPTRLKYYDYSQPGSYFITICTHGRKNILTQIIVGDGLLDVPYSKMLPYGEIVDRIIMQMSNFYKYINVDKYVIMPNHIHLLLSITENALSKGTPRTLSPTSSTIAQFVSTFKRFTSKECKESIWQRSFHDHIIRNERDFQKIWSYIDTNVNRWEKDIFYVTE